MCDQIYGQIFDQAFDRGFDQGLGEEKKHKYTVQFDLALRKKNTT